MIHKLIIRNFKKFQEKVEIDLTPPVVFIGPNNSGKTSALQALSLWFTGYQKWVEKRGFDKEKHPKERPGITINRKDLSAIPISITKNIWHNLRTHYYNKEKGKNENIYIDIVVQGTEIVVENNEKKIKSWESGFEFYYANEESFYCRPLRMSSAEKPKRMPVPELSKTSIAFLPPMSGLAEQEFHKQLGEIEFLIGQGQTAQVLRNLCFQVYKSNQENWNKVVEHLKELFGIHLLAPEYTKRDEIKIFYKENDVKLDLSASGRGVQQVLLLLVYLYANPNSVLLLDEPDAHLEILRQRQIYDLILEIAETNNSQIIAASHSEVILDETARRNGNVIAFIGKPHKMNKKEEVKKSLDLIGWDQYYLAQIKKWVLYLEGTTDFDILKAFAKKLNHPVYKHLEQAFVVFKRNEYKEVKRHFYGIKEAMPELLGVAIFDNLGKDVANDKDLTIYQWTKNEIENFLIPNRKIFFRLVVDELKSEGIKESDLFYETEKEKRIKAMVEALEQIENAYRTLGKNPYDGSLKVSDEFINKVFEMYAKIQGIPPLLRKGRYYKLVQYLEEDEIDKEIIEVLDMIYHISQKAENNINNN